MIVAGQANTTIIILNVCFLFRVWDLLVCFVLSATLRFVRVTACIIIIVL